jgi:hypothetical protein
MRESGHDRRPDERTMVVVWRVELYVSRAAACERLVGALDPRECVVVEDNGKPGILELLEAAFL